MKLVLQPCAESSWGLPRTEACKSQKMSFALRPVHEMTITKIQHLIGGNFTTTDTSSSSFILPTLLTLKLHQSPPKC